jgi:Zn-dependent M16 (insulinase) family peptidase
VDDAEKIIRQATFTTKFLDDKVDDALSLLRDLIFEIDPRDVPRLKDVLLQSRSHQRMRPTSDGMGLALRHAGRGINLEGHLNEILGGVPQIHLFEKITEASPDPLLERIEAIRKFLLNPARMNVSFTGADKPADRVRKRMTEWGSAMRSEPIRESASDFQPSTSPRREGLAAPMNVAYCTTVMPSRHISHPDGPRLAVAARLLSLGYVLEEVRFKGTAYGGGCGYNGASRVWSFHSYRDPWINRTLDVYSASLKHVKDAKWSQGDVDRAIIGTAKEGERPIRPPQATGTALWRYLIGDTPERRDARHAAMLGVTLADVRRVLVEQFESNWSKASVCVTSSRKKLEEANSERPDQTLEISDILKTTVT